jgi:hypothetical protein
VLLGVFIWAVIKVGQGWKEPDDGEMRNVRREAPWRDERERPE